VTDEETPIFERGDVVYGDDPFKGEEDARPGSFLSNHEGHPFHGDQYIALTLTSKSWMDGLIEAPEESWVRGGTRTRSRIVPWAVQSIDQEDIDFWARPSRQRFLLTRRWLPSSKNYNSFSEVSFNKRFSETAVRWQPQFPQKLRPVLSMHTL